MPILAAGHTDTGHRTPQSELGASKVGIGLGLGKTLFSASLSFLGPSDINVGGQFGGFRQDGHLIVGDLGKAAGNEDPMSLIALTIVQIADFQRGEHRGMLGQKTELAVYAAGTHIVHFRVEHDFVRSDDIKTKTFQSGLLYACC